MPLLVADIGNAHTVLGLLEPGADGGPGTVGDHWRIATDERRTADEWAVLLRGLLGRLLCGLLSWLMRWLLNRLLSRLLTRLV